MAKAWRNGNANKINKLRALEFAALGYAVTPTARTQKNQREYIGKLSRSWPRSNWLLDGLLVRAGIISEQQLKGTDIKVTEAVPVSAIEKVKAAFKTIKNWFKR